MHEPREMVIVGGGQAGGRAAAALRERGYTGALCLIGAETEPPYERPPLSKEGLLTDAPPKYVNPPAFYPAHDIELRTGSKVVAINRARREVVLSCGRSQRYDRLLLATGARVRRLNVAGSDLPQVLYLRTIEDAHGLRRRLRAGVRVVVIGGGFIGLEAAASARQLDCEVTVLETADRLMQRAVPDIVSSEFLDLHCARGVKVELGVRLIAIEGSDAVQAVRLADGRRIVADVIIVGIGVTPRTELAQAAGLQTADGIVVDQCGRTSDPRIFAAGDATTQIHPIPGRQVRLECWQNAQDQAVAAADALCGLPPSEPSAPWVWSDQFGCNLQMAGFPMEAGELVVRRGSDANSFSAFRVQGARLVGAVSVNCPQDMVLARRLLGSAVSTEVLSDQRRRLRAAAL